MSALFQLPTINADAQTLDERGWRRVNHGETVKSSWQAYILLPYPHWRISAYRTSDKYVHTGLAHYRAPASFAAWREVLPQMLSKWWGRLRGRV